MHPHFKKSLKLLFYPPPLPLPPPSLFCLHLSHPHLPPFLFLTPLPSPTLSSLRPPIAMLAIIEPTTALSNPPSWYSLLAKSEVWMIHIDY
ncbi:hypothetical protein AAZX31_09G049700 [Glycine max]